MADITMCAGKGCPQKDECSRHTAEPNPYRQGYFVHLPYMQPKPCEMFVKDDRKEKDESK